MRHRIFIAINLPESVKKKLASYQEKIEELFTPYRNEVSGTGPIRWTKPENLHITLAFLGYLSDEEVAEVCKIAEEVASKSQPLSVNLNKICYGPPKKMPRGPRQAGGRRGGWSPRMVWVAGEQSKELTKLKSDLDNALSAGSRYQKESRAFTPHITLGRIRQWEFRQIEPEDRPEVETDLSLGFDVSSIEVMESHLKRGGAEYTILESCPLSK